MQAAVPQPDPLGEKHSPLRALSVADVDPDTVAHPPTADVDATDVAHIDDDGALAPIVPLVRQRTPPSRLQALVVLLVLPLALIATAVIVRPPRAVVRPEVLVVGPMAGTRWAHDTLDDLGPVVLTSSGSPSTPKATTEIHYRGEGARAQAESVRRTLGRGTLVEAPALKESFPVVVYLGRDTPRQ